MKISTENLRPLLVLAALGFLMVFIGVFGLLSMRSDFAYKQATLTVGMSLDDVQDIMGPPNLVLSKGEAIRHQFESDDTVPVISNTALVFYVYFHVVYVFIDEDDKVEAVFFVAA